MKLKNVTIAGGGVLGSQIAFQSAYCGFNVTVWLLDEQCCKETQEKLKNLKKVYTNTIKLMAKPEGQTQAKWANGIADFKTFSKEDCLEKVEQAYKNIKLETNLEKAVANADIVVESIIEDLKIKNDFFKNMSKFLPPKTIIATNSSTISPSKMAKSTERENKFLCLHFANQIWRNNTAEVMGHKNTSQEAFDAVLKFAKDIKMVALPLKKEKAGYILNSMLVPFLFSAMDLLVNDISDIESIDKAWTLGTGAPAGPFQILDIVGIATAYNIVKMYTKIPSFLAPYNFKAMAKYLKKMLDEGKTGKDAGEGFYKYKK